ncbi:facilitated trehalose transporter Tret1-like isoform X2 [Thrips palmi]|uniref:Facilitated trehalose transporter Tret1-like isoform X2 n=1 Tax=Thrips palmi TaxID=161013 RepID=A0A6P8Z0E1_THRPL|nr:facilitated trehalose transporter Tret1-like isoform X2 [Thrips palmi]
MVLKEIGGVGETLRAKVQWTPDCCIPGKEKDEMAEKGHDASAQASPTPHWKLLLMQVCLGVVANMGGISAGANLGFSAVALPQMRHPNATMSVNAEEASWIAGVSALATPVGCLLSGWLLDRLGRRPALLWQNVPALLGWLLLAVPADSLGLPGKAHGLGAVYFGRILTGLATGMGSVPGTVYVAEVGLKQLRGMLVTWTSIAISLGIVTVYVIGAVLPSWRLVAVVCAALPLLSAVLVYAVVVESPVWLLGRGRLAEARTALARTRLAHPGDVDEELASMLRNRPKPSTARSSGLRGVLSDLRHPECWKPLLIMNAFFLFQQLSGVFVVIFYAVDMVVEAGVAADPYLVAVLIGVARLLVTLVTGFLSNRVGRRPLAIVSGAGMAVCMTALATHLLLQSRGDHAGLLPGPWLPAAALVSFILASTLGFLTLPWAMIGEVFPARFRGAAGGFTTCSAYLYSFAVVKAHPGAMQALGRHGVFFLYGAMALLGTLFVALALPETQGRSLQDIEDYFRGRKRVALDSADAEAAARLHVPAQAKQSTELKPLNGSAAAKT